jgi:hypothetical protein
LLSVAAAGVFFARRERWQEDLAAPAIGLFPGHRENEYQRFEGLGMPSEYIDDVYVAHAVHAQLADMWSLQFPRKTRSGSSICRGHRIDPGSPGVHSREVTCMPESV